MKPSVGEYVKAIYDFYTDRKGEIALRKCDVVLVTAIVNENWLCGKLGDCEGNFPVNFIERLQLPHTQDGQRNFMATENFPAQQHGDLEFRKGELILGYYAIDHNWWYGTLAGLEGIFPLTHVRELKSQSIQSQLKADSSHCDNLQVRALVDSIPQLDEELGFKAGDIITIIKVVDDDWYIGECCNKQGMFLSQCVEFLDKDKKNQLKTTNSVWSCNSATTISQPRTARSSSYTSENTRSHDSSVAPYAKTLFPFVAKASNELTFAANDIVKLKRHIDDEWIEGELDGQVGIFPASYIEIIVDCPGHKNNSVFPIRENINLHHKEKIDFKEQDTECYGLVLYNFKAETSNDLNLQEGDTVVVLKQIDKNWFLAKDETGEVGYCPVNFIEVVGSEPTQDLQEKADNTIQVSSENIQTRDLMRSFDTKQHPLDSDKSKILDASKSEHHSIDSKTLLQSQHSLSKEDCTTSFSKSMSNFHDAYSSDISINNTNAENTVFKTAKADILKPKPSLAPKPILKPKSVHILKTGQNGTESKTMRPQTLCSGGRSNLDSSSLNLLAKEEMEKVKRLSGISVSDEISNEDFKKSRSKKESLQEKDVDMHVFSVEMPCPNVVKLDIGDQMVEYSKVQDEAQIEIKDQSTVKLIPHRPPLPHKNSSVSIASDFDRKPSLRKPPPPRPTGPALCTAPPRNGQEFVQHQKISDVMTPSRPAPPRPLPRSTPLRRKQAEVTSPSDLIAFSPNSSQTDAEEEFGATLINDLKNKIKDTETSLEKFQKSREELELMMSNVEEDEQDEIHETVHYYSMKMHGLMEELKTLKASLNQMSGLDTTGKATAAADAKRQAEEEEEKRISEMKQKRKENRVNVIEELLRTEHDFLRDLQLCLKYFLSPETEKISGIDIELLFCNIEEIMEISQQLLHSMEAAILNKDFEDQVIGPCFTNLSEDMKQAYAPYCKNHDDVITLLEKYEEVDEIKEYFEAYVASMRQHTNVFDLGSVLIKPVQRILKYPLLLSELLKTTDQDHADKTELPKAINAMTGVATAINEYKRRKDLVFKYKRNIGETFGAKIAKLNFHSILKKSTRMKGRLSSNLGIGLQTRDEQFEKEEARFRNIENIARLLLRNVERYMEQLEEYISSWEMFLEDVVKLHADHKPAELDRYKEVNELICDKFFIEFVSVVQRVVISPLKKLLPLFSGPDKVIQKRFDKLLDYDSLLRKSKHLEKTGDVVRDAQNNYAALNAQLLDELPKMCQLSYELLKECINSFTKAQRDFYNKVVKEMYTLFDLPFLLSLSDDMLEFFDARHKTTVDMLSLLDFIPRGFGSKVVVIEKPNRRVKRQALEKQPTQDPISIQQNDSHRNKLRQKYPQDRIYLVNQNYTCADIMELSASENDIVAVIKEQDPMGNKDRWLVDNGATKGFLPKTHLTLPDPSLNEISTYLLGSDEIPSINVDTTGITKQFSEEEEEFYVAEYPFESSGPNEVSLFEGQLVSILAKQDLDGNPEWWMVDADGNQGYVPASYLLKVNEATPS